MTSGQDVSEYLKNAAKKKLEKNREKKSWCSDAPEDEVISLFVGLLVNPDMKLSPMSLNHVVNSAGFGNLLSSCRGQKFLCESKSLQET
jgi:hypothetical protein